jgi:hypothetical protein
MALTLLSFDATERLCLLQTRGVKENVHQDWASGIILHTSIKSLVH